jgi:RpiR family transcriptional regulator, carbohydrate utilization regulator
MNDSITANKISFSIRLAREQNNLSKKEKVICTYIQENSRDVIHMSISELAERCKASEAAIVRVSQKLGYKGFQAMKISIAQDVIEPSMQIYEELSPDDTIPTIIEKVFHSNAQALTDTLTVLKKNNVEKAIDLIINAEHLLFYGVGGSNIIAQDAQHKFIRIGYLPLAFPDSNIQAMSASILSPNDVVVAISHSGASSAILDVVSIAKEAGAKVITITNYSRSPLLNFSDVPLFTSSPETAFKTEALSSRIAELAIIDSLFIGAVFKRYDEALENMKKTRHALDSKKV